MTKHYEEMKLRCELGELGLGDLKDIQNVEDADKAEDEESDNDCRQNSATKEGSKRQPEHLLQRASQVRQRQSTSHIFCIERLLRENFRMEQFGELQSKLKEIGNKQTILDQMQRGMESDDGISKYKIGLEILQERKETFFGKYFNLMPILEILAEECNARGTTCLLCKTEKPPKEPVISDEVSRIWKERIREIHANNETSARIFSARDAYS